MPTPPLALPLAWLATAAAGPSSAVVALPRGTGFVASEAGLVLTNAHVVGTATTLPAVRASGRRSEARVLAVFPGIDLAVLRLAGPRPEAWLALDPTPLAVDQELAFATAAGGGAGRDRTCHVERRGHIGGVPVVAHDCPVWWGSSGSPLVGPAGVRAVHFAWAEDDTLGGGALAVEIAALPDHLPPWMARELGLRSSRSDRPPHAPTHPFRLQE